MLYFFVPSSSIVPVFPVKMCTCLQSGQKYFAVEFLHCLGRAQVVEGKCIYAVVAYCIGLNQLRQYVRNIFSVSRREESTSCCDLSHAGRFYVAPTTQATPRQRSVVMHPGFLYCIRGTRASGLVPTSLTKIHYYPRRFS